MDSKSAGLWLSPGRLTGSLAIASALLVLVSYGGQVLKYQFGIYRSMGIIQQLDVDAEINFATWYSGSLLLLCAGLLWVISRVQTHARIGWLGLCVIFALLSLDESVALHEKSIDYLRARLHLGGFLYYPWVILGAVFALIVFVVYIPFLTRLPARSRNLFLLSGAIYLTGAIVLEMIGARYASVHDELNLRFASIAHLEEAFELAGSVLFVYALLDYLRRHFSPLVVQFENPPAHLPSTSP